MNPESILELARGLVRPVVCLLLVGGVLLMSVTGHPVPEPLGTLTVGVVSYFFGDRSARRTAAVPAGEPSE